MGTPKLVQTPRQELCDRSAVGSALPLQQVFPLGRPVGTSGLSCVAGELLALFSSMSFILSSRFFLAPLWI